MSEKIEQKVILHLLDINELSESEIALLEKAKKAMKNAYAPYSHFGVGAALLMEDGQILAANNQENASFPVGVCAERVLLGFAHANFPELRPLKIMIVAQRFHEAGFATVSPCGLCRQTINEYEVKFGRPIEILMLTPEGKVLKAANVSQLLPFKFDDLNS
ncbi:cytidine deaminase [Echinicola vietnamensis]|uniref:Cytidine deaminase n=1 Tax=Echinicola vietnamensis (strain DSM 17526 / LMG 23754 / KMM 6221) TaxID=926556 RepID=L0FZN6_ECHVK|nr:cytidine deaminase [Echinicola vietnamensis]AGA78075.1 cytidine deaminase [Echinicola vietnamensis DSM 17526]